MNISKSSTRTTTTLSSSMLKEPYEIVLEVCNQDDFQRKPKTGYTYAHDFVMSPSGELIDPGMPNMAREPLRTTPVTLHLGGEEFDDSLVKRTTTTTTSATTKLTTTRCQCSSCISTATNLNNNKDTTASHVLRSRTIGSSSSSSIRASRHCPACCCTHCIPSGYSLSSHNTSAMNATSSSLTSLTSSLTSSFTSATLSTSQGAMAGLRSVYTALITVFFSSFTSIGCIASALWLAVVQTLHALYTSAHQQLRSRYRSWTTAGFNFLPRASRSTTRGVDSASLLSNDTITNSSTASSSDTTRTTTTTTTTSTTSSQFTSHPYPTPIVGVKSRRSLAPKQPHQFFTSTPVIQDSRHRKTSLVTRTLVADKTMDSGIDVASTSFVNTSLSFIKQALFIRKRVLFIIFILPILLASGIFFLFLAPNASEITKYQEYKHPAAEIIPSESTTPSPSPPIEAPAEVPEVAPLVAPTPIAPSSSCCGDLQSYTSALSLISTSLTSMGSKVKRLKLHARKLDRTLRNLHHNQYTSIEETKKNNLISEEKMISITERLEKIKSLSTKTEQSYPVVDLSNYLSKDDIKTMIAKELEIFAADKIGMVDYALESIGGSVLTTRCSRTYNFKTSSLSLFGYRLWYTGNSARVAIQPQTNVGECWPIQGSVGQLCISLATPIKVTAITIDHISAALILDGKHDSALKDFFITGLNSEFDLSPVHLGTFQYDINSTPIQTFYIEEDKIAVFPIVQLNIVSNYGNEKYTCLYRFRVHGESPDKPANIN